MSKRSGDSARAILLCGQFHGCHGGGGCVALLQRLTKDADNAFDTVATLRPTFSGCIDFYGSCCSGFHRSAYIMIVSPLQEQIYIHMPHRLNVVIC